jgi:hypothetical protein
MNTDQIILYVLLLYIVVGLCTGAGFVTAGVARVLPHPTTFTLGARILLLPGAAALWPYVLLRWLRARRRP